MVKTQLEWYPHPGTTHPQHCSLVVVMKSWLMKTLDEVPEHMMYSRNGEEEDHFAMPDPFKGEWKITVD